MEDKELASKSKVTRSLRKSSYVASGFAGVTGEGEGHSVGPDIWRKLSKSGKMR